MKKVVDGLVLREMISGENDRRILLLTAEQGKLWLVAKGARSMKSKTASLCRLFSYVNVEYYEKGGMCWLSGGSLNKSFFGSHTDIDGFSLGAYILQVADEISGEELPAEEVLRMTLNTLYAIDGRLKPYAQIKAAYELFAVNVSGLAPDPTACADCGCESFEGEIWLDVMNGAVVCGECLKKRSGGLPLPETDAYEARNILVPLDAASLEAIRYVMSAPPQRLFAFGLSDKRSLELFARAAETYLLNHLERDFDTLRFYKSIKDTDH